MMKAIVLTGSGDPMSVFEYRDLPIPIPKSGEAQINVHALSINPYEGYARAGFGFSAPRSFPVCLGGDYCGTITALGPDTDGCGFSVGDTIVSYLFHGRWTLATGATAQYVCTPVSRLVRKPAKLSNEATSTIVVAGLTALTAVKHGKVSEGKTVAVVGASGGVGSFAVGLSRALVGDTGKVIGICSGAKADFVRNCGATHMVTYNTGDVAPQFASIIGSGKIDILIDCYGKGSCTKYGAFVNTRDANSAIVTIADHGFRKPGDWTCSYTRFICANDDDGTRTGLEEISQMFDEGRLDGLASVLPQRVLEWEDYPQAHVMIGSGHTMGKIAIKVPPL